MYDGGTALHTIFDRRIYSHFYYRTFSRR